MLKPDVERAVGTARELNFTIPEPPRGSQLYLDEKGYVRPLRGYFGMTRDAIQRIEDLTRQPREKIDIDDEALQLVAQDLVRTARENSFFDWAIKLAYQTGLCSDEQGFVPSQVAQRDIEDAVRKTEFVFPTGESHTLLDLFDNDIDACRYILFTGYQEAVARSLERQGMSPDGVFGSFGKVRERTSIKSDYIIYCLEFIAGSPELQHIVYGAKGEAVEILERIHDVLYNEDARRAFQQFVNKSGGKQFIAAQAAEYESNDIPASHDFLDQAYIACNNNAELYLQYILYVMTLRSHLGLEWFMRNELNAVDAYDVVKENIPIVEQYEDMIEGQLQLIEEIVGYYDDRYIRPDEEFE
jgi:hypothetical protein